MTVAARDDARMIKAARKPLSWRTTLRKAHLWIGAGLCLPLGLQGLSGTTMILGDLLTLKAVPVASASSPAPHAIGDIIAAAKKAAPQGAAPAMVLMPEDGEGFVTIRLAKPGGRGARVLLTVDPKTLDARLLHEGFLRTVFLYHANLLMDGRTGRAIIGSYGAAMLLLGISGIVLWWPSPKRWSSAFSVSIHGGIRRLLRDLHGLFGFIGMASLMAISATGLYLAYPQTIGSLIAPGAPRGDTNLKVDPIEGIQPLDADGALALALKAVPASHARSLALPMRKDQSYRVMLARDADSQGTPPVTVLVDPWQKQVAEVRDPRQFDLGPRIVAWMHSVHEGRGLGAVWLAIVTLTGLLPAFLASTGIAMWLLRRRAAKRGRAATVKRHSEAQV